MIPRLVLSDVKGNIFVHPVLTMAGGSGREFSVPSEHELIPLPQGSTLFFMPHHAAIAWDEEADDYAAVAEFRGRHVFPVAAFLIPGFTRLYFPAAKKLNKGTIFPLWPYTAVGWRKGRFYVAAYPIDRSRRQRPYYYRSTALIEKNIRIAERKFPGNRLFRHLSRCAREYNCRNAQDLFLKRGEAPLPVSPVCNARCLGCLSFQDSDCAEASHERISFVPTPQEVFEVAFSHLSEARDPIASFGQGCEGEPLLQFKLLREAILRVRKQTRRGVLHLNTNGFHSGFLEELARAGLDSVRISLNSLDEACYRAYYRPQGFSLKDVLESIRRAKKSGLFVSLNLLTFPGVTDTEKEVNALTRFLKKGFVDLLQLRNLSIDPEFFMERQLSPLGESMGLFGMIELLKKHCPKVRLGYFNARACGII